MATDMDIDMDIDIDFNEDIPVQSVDSTSNPDTSEFFNPSEANPILSTPNNNSESRALDLVPNKVHLRGLENLTTNDIYDFVATYFESHKPSQIEWIDDTSANLIYQSPDIASKALLSLSADEIPDISQLPALQIFQAKAFSKYPLAKLEVRRSVISDKKQAGARDRSRFYLFNPEYDPSTRLGKRKNSGIVKKYRNRDDEAYRCQNYEDYEKQRKDENMKFDLGLNEDSEDPNRSRSWKRGRKREYSSGSEVIDRVSLHVHSQKLGKELFPNREEPNCGRLRNWSASPLWNDKENPTEIYSVTESRTPQQVASANGLKTYTSQKPSKLNHNKELFPERYSNYRLDDFSKREPNKQFKSTNGLIKLGPIDQNIQQNSYDSAATGSTKRGIESSSRIKIRGIANPLSSSTLDFNIKGAASGLRAKELFPSVLEDDLRKDNFVKVTSGRGQRRKATKNPFP